MVKRDSADVTKLRVWGEGIIMDDSSGFHMIMRDLVRGKQYEWQEVLWQQKPRDRERLENATLLALKNGEWVHGQRSTCVL